MKQFPIYYLSLLLFAGCTSTEKNYVARVKLQTLTTADIFNRNMVSDVIFDSQELQSDSMKNKSRQLFLKGMDLYKNKKDPAGAVALLKQSILTFPDAKTYYELGNALVDCKDAASCQQAIDSYNVASHLDFKPQSMVYYKMATAYNLWHQIDQNISLENVTHRLNLAFDSGFADTTMLYADKHLATFINTPEFTKMYHALDLSKIAKSSASGLFAMYKKAFQEYKQPYEISFNDLEGTNDRQSINFEFAKFIPEMQNTSFGREVSHEYFYVAKVAETPAYTALIYSSISFYGMDNMQPVTTKLVTYDADGNIIASRIFAGQFSAEKIKVGKIDNNEITLQDYKRVWKKPIDEVSFEDNEVEKYVLQAKAIFRLTETGEIMEVSVPSNYSDSVVFAKN
ncbi:MAG: hypothetical protein JWP12_2740 [Bacteroidetes bacterium]|nr:hypothetical protein [Bacteroidota bacterium]